MQSLAFYEGVIMKILVFSDTHGDVTKMERAIRSHSDAEVIIHCGDGEMDVEYAKRNFPDRAFLNVKGNCDWGSSHDPTLEITLEGKKIFVTHGHLYNAKMGLQNLIYAGKEKNADIVLYGHTHISMNEYIDGMYVMNPGSCHGYGATYGIIDISDKGILTNIASAK